MIVDYLVLADGVHADVEKHHMLGAGWDVLYANDDSYTFARMAAAVRVRFDDGDEVVPLEFDVCDDDSHSILPEPIRVDARWYLAERWAPGVPRRAYLGFTLSQIEFGRPGVFHAVVRRGTVELARESFSVVDASGPIPRAVPISTASDSGPDEPVRAWRRKS